jgi:formylglycine-generating enzyme
MNPNNEFSSLDAWQSAAIRRIAAQMVTIDAGSVMLKDEKSERRWEVGLRPFRISKYVVTQEEYLLIYKGQLADRKCSRKPRVDVSWADAIKFCNLLSRTADLPECYSLDADGEIVCDWDSIGYRLPSEAEWEFACRAGCSQVTYGNLDEIAWYRDNSSEQLHEVGAKRPNAWGLFDMIGNVWEWCWDIYDAEAYGPYRVFRGGGWCDSPHGCRASCRRKSHPTFQIDDLGFRLAQSAR